MSRVGWLDGSAGVSGDMLLGALDDLGVLGELPAVLDSMGDLGAIAVAERTTRHGMAATSYRISAGSDQPSRRLADVEAIVSSAAVGRPVRDRAIAVFRRLAAIEGAVHGVAPESVHFHEVGAVDSIVDVLGGCLGLDALGLDALVVSPIALGGGDVGTAHGVLPVPVPAVLALLAGTDLVGYGGTADLELATPTGAPLLAEWATTTGPMPTMTVDAVGIGAGQRDLADRANVVRLVVGRAADVGDDSDDGAAAASWLTIEANVDDLDPRVWPVVLDRLLAAGAADAWLTPILMKKGRPAYTVSALVAPVDAAAVRHVLVTETSTIGVRTTSVAKHALDRSWLTVDVGGQQVRVKLAHDGERRTNLAPEFDDAAAAATALGVPVKDVLARATSAALRQLDD
jgi:uncharacterized protein (TIGR00299 family) protein